MKRSHSATGRGNVIGDKLPDLSLPETLLNIDMQGREDSVPESIRMPAFLPLPHRVQSSRELDDAFGPVHDSPDFTASTSLPRNKASVTFAEDTSGSRSRSNSGGEGRKDRPRPARLELTPRRMATSSDMVEHLAYTTSSPAEAMALERSSSSRVTVKGVPVAEPMSTSSSTSSTSSFGMSPMSARRRMRPWSAYEMSPAKVAQAFSALKSNNGRFDGPAATSAFSFDSPEMRSSGPGSSTLYSPSPLSPMSCLDSPSGSRFRSSSLGSPNSKGKYSPSLPLSPCHGRRKGATSSLGLNAGTLEASKGEQRLGANPLNRNLLAPGGLATGEGVYDGLVIPCASVHLGSDDEDDEERKALSIRNGTAGGSKGVMKKWLSRKKSSMGAART